MSIRYRALESLSPTRIALGAAALTAIIAFGGAYAAVASEGHVIVKASFTAMGAVAVLFSGKAIAKWERKAATPELLIKTKAIGTMLRLEVYTPSDKIESAVICFHVPAHVERVEFPETNFQGTIVALVTGGSSVDDLTNRIEISFDKFSSNQHKTVLIYLKPVVGREVRTFDQSLYEVSYAWWYKGDRSTARYWREVGTDQSMPDYGIRNGAVQLVESRSGTGVVVSAQFYAVDGKEPEYKVELKSELGIGSRNGSMLSHFTLMRWNPKSRESTLETFRLVEWTESLALYRKRSSISEGASLPVRRFANV